jgi:predicted kinase
VRANFQELFQAALSDDRVEQLRGLFRWSHRVFQSREREMLKRKEQGFVRECHGDMHLGNMILDNGTVTIFDCIEFNEEFRWIDVMNEVAFCFMDLLDWERKDLAFRFLNAYLQVTGDYSGLMVLPFYAVYRALVRAKVDWIRLRQELDAIAPTEGPIASRSVAESPTAAAPASSQSTSDSREYAEVDPTLFHQLHSYLDLAQQCAQSQRCYIVITHGVSGSGKTYASQLLLESLGAIRIRTDVERKRIFGIEVTRSSGSLVGEQMYATSVTARTYKRILSQAAVVLEAGFPVILDGTFLRREQRSLVQQLAQQRGVPLRILHLDTKPETLRRRILHRIQAGDDASEADLEVLQHQQTIQEPLSAEEHEWTVNFDSEAMVAEDLVARVMNSLGSP